MHIKEESNTKFIVSKKIAKRIREIIEEKIESPNIKDPKSALDVYISMLQIVKGEHVYKKILQNIRKSATKMILSGMGKKIKMLYECLKNKNINEKCRGMMGWVGPENRMPKFLREYSDMCDICMSIYDEKKIKSDVLKAIDSSTVFKIIKSIPLV